MRYIGGTFINGLQRLGVTLKLFVIQFYFLCRLLIHSKMWCILHCAAVKTLVDG